jgi:GGDEF domain-containing protein
MRGRHRPSTRTREHVALDELTGVWNRRGFVAAAQPVFLSSLRRGTPVALAYFDLEFASGDRHLAPADDAVATRVLAAAAGQLRHAFRATDVIGRIGAYRFAVLLADCADDVVAALDGRRPLTDPGMSDLDVALVVSSVRGDEFATFDAVMAAAEDRAAGGMRSARR